MAGMNLEQFRLVEREFKAYLEEVHPLILDAELHYGKFPTAVLNELRAFHTHISRCFENGLSDEDIRKEIQGSSRHMLRIKLDLYKYVILALHDTYYERFQSDTQGVRLEMIDDGNFEIAYKNLCAEAVRKTKRAKQVEVKSPDDSLDLFSDALEVWRKLESLVDDNTERIIYAKRVYRKEKILLKPITWILGSIGSALIGLAIAQLFE